MHNIAPLTKLILTISVSIWAILMNSLYGFTALVAVLLLMLLAAKADSKIFKAVGALALVALVLVAIQYGCGMNVEEAAVGGFRMLVMTMAFVVLLSTTRIQDLTAAMVRQCYIPYEYAFMFTTALRFIPDFLAESQAVQEAQACRGYSPRGNILKKLLGYLAIVKPLVLRAISRSETMAMSLEIRGFGSRGRHSFAGNIELSSKDYLLFLGMGGVSSWLFVLHIKAFI